MSTAKARLLCLPKLRECLQDANAFGVVTGDHEPARMISLAIQAAERYEPADSFKACLNCNRQHQRKSAYCCFECAEEDGAVMK